VQSAFLKALENLDGCDPCRVVVDNLRRTITLCKNGAPHEDP
jgi:hypothetical protein